MFAIIMAAFTTRHTRQLSHEGRIRATEPAPPTQCSLSPRTAHRGWLITQGSAKVTEPSCTVTARGGERRLSQS